LNIHTNYYIAHVFFGFSTSAQCITNQRGSSNCSTYQQHLIFFVIHVVIFHRLVLHITLFHQVPFSLGIVQMVLNFQGLSRKLLWMFIFISLWAIRSIQHCSANSYKAHCQVAMLFSLYMYQYLYIYFILLLLN